MSNAQEKKSESEESNNDAATQTSASSIIGFLELTHIQKLGRQRLALFSDGVSGAIQIVEGRNIDQYKRSASFIASFFNRYKSVSSECDSHRTAAS
ncbi:hypothetical protein [Vibrio metschnikovii]|uniref:hypothetical protein n=1 Tax=Vibrio metschnikovii TaxID=28172 RepID=UPI001C2F4CB2|nr:hypothetical protein [Vibrio metschnikovii]